MNRKESDVFSDLEELCQFPGYIHAIAYLCFKDNFIYFTKEITKNDVLEQFSDEKLLRTEISILIGLMCKFQINFTLPRPRKLQEYIDNTIKLLEELHVILINNVNLNFDPETFDNPQSNPLSSGEVLREAIFYGGESAYHFQYRDFSKTKYSEDSVWLLKNKGFSIDQAIQIVSTIQEILLTNINNFIENLPSKNPDKWSFLDPFVFSAKEVSSNSGIDFNTVKNLIESFVTPIGFCDYKSIDDFNPTNAYPVISYDNENYILLQNYSLVEALYETPYFWFNEDPLYKDTAMSHRGTFTEKIASELLKRVFGKDNVYSNVFIVDSKKNRVGEIDVLVLFADRAIVLQAKSKKLTIAARKGNEIELRVDFKKAVQDACDQAFTCASLLTSDEHRIVDEQNIEILKISGLKEIYPFCIVSDHYPALFFQSKQFLNQKYTKAIKRAFVTDLFFLDVVTEFLNTPLRFLSYINKRTLYDDRLFSSFELTILSYHLKNNLWIDSKHDFVHLSDDICADLDLAMLSRRDNIPGNKTPEGVLTLFKGTFFDQIIEKIENLENTATIDLGFLLLTVSSDTIKVLNSGIEELLQLSKDGKHHDFTIGLEDGFTGITIHCNSDSDELAAKRLNGHCELRKYKLRSNKWFGICLNSESGELRFGVSMQFKWKRERLMDRLTKKMANSKTIRAKNKELLNRLTKRKKIGRNSLCPCGSGKKYKHCCLDKH